MNIRLLALFLVFAAGEGLAQAPSTSGQERAAMLSTLSHGKPIAGYAEHYWHLPEVQAVTRKGEGETPRQALARTGEGGTIVETKERLVFYRIGRKMPARLEIKAASTIYPTVLNTRTGNFGVLTGTLIVKPKKMTDSAAIAGAYGLEVATEFPHLGTVFFRVKPNTDIADAAAGLQADARVESAYPEIIEHMRVPK